MASDSKDKSKENGNSKEDTESKDESTENTKEESNGAKRLEDELAEQRPFYLLILGALLTVSFFIYDFLLFIPFKLFADPEKKRELSDRVKAQPTEEGNPASGWRHVESTKELLSNVYDGCETLGEIWDKTVEEYDDQPSMGTRQLLKGEEIQKNGKTFLQLTFGSYIFDNFTEVDDRVSSIIAWFSSVEVKKGDHVVIFAETRAEWMQTAIACFKYGLPVITVYATLGEEAVTYALKECDGKVIFTSRNLLKKVAKALEHCPETHTVVYYEELHRIDGDDGHAKPANDDVFTNMGKKLESFESLLDYDLEPSMIQEKPKPNDLAMIMYTSGTTGNPKGVMLSHKNIIAAISGQGKILQVRPGDRFIGYLPLAHILEVCAELVVLNKGACIGYSSAQTLFDRAPKIKRGTKGDCAELKPTLIACVPAVMDRIFKAVTEEVKNMNPVLRELFRICYERKRARYEEGYSSLIMNKLTFNRIGKLLGGNLRFVLSGGAPLNAETQRFINICFCCPVVQGYGLTETCGGATLGDAYDLTTGSVGPPLRCCEIKLREWSDAGYSPHNDSPQGEVLIHGDNVGIGYFKNEAKTAEEFIKIDNKRYFATGDIGEFREDGSLKIIDRKKDLIKLSHGEYISLGKVETTLMTHPIVDNIAVYGDSQKDFLIGLVVPNKKNLEKLAKENGVSGSWEELCKNEELTEALTKDLSSSVSGKLNKVEIPRKLILCHEPWSPVNGFLTEALKLKRKNIEKAFEKEIKKAYE